MLIVRALGQTDYVSTWQAMQRFTASRQPNTPDELWLTEHPPVYTLGLNRRGAVPPLRNDIPLVLTDRGGKMTYHGPGQIVVYLLLDLKRRGWRVRDVVDCMEQSVIQLLARQGLSACQRADAPGVYVTGQKIASLGLRLKPQGCYHGLALNVEMDLKPFNAIDPCGYRGMPVTQTHDLGITTSYAELAQQLLNNLQTTLEHDTTH